ncbi:carbohydrate ABC transporter permease [Paenibacillus sacheonensis]|uniref:ABC transporter permease subunit n=1 Tax=Paenibacillus sacheonensis TaxID=742054 RepID=A0A7X5C4L8_9BACL|nr:carbohydrate ABC transporter permease [Paenibacillus sacheonensis]MBM7568808.1 N-acetylglucosamine transport system permease protein [Paenibacillus sacheonensis]NBC72514.1 ABC transporter permease subunit [Paenibacillus sacheonensis]
MRSRTAKRIGSLLPAYIPLYAWLIFTIILFGWVILASLSTTRDIFTNSLLGSGIHWSNYSGLFKDQGMGRYFANSVVYTVVSCIGIIAVAAPAAYILGRARFRGRALASTMFMSALAIPSILITIPLFSVFVALKLTGSVVTLVIVYICTNVPFGVFFLTGFFSSIPKEFEESAAMDGCGPIRTFVSIILPVAQPGIVTLSIFNFLGVWNEYFYALIFANDSSARTLALSLQSIVYGFANTGNYGGIFAACMVVFLPSFAVYLFVSKRIIAGLTVGAVKG